MRNILQNSINFKNNRLNKYKNIFVESFLNKISQNLENEIQVLFDDYRFDMTYDEFKFCIQKENILSRILSKRICDSEVLEQLITNINVLINQKIHKESYLINPLIYLRVCRNNDSFIVKDAKFYTEPHYDRAANESIKFFSVWVPLESTSDETGTLLYFELERELREKYFPYNSEKNTLNMIKYFENYEMFDTILNQKEINVYCDKGDIILFNENCLHGASKPKKINRKSINFTIFNGDMLDNDDVTNFEKNKLLLSSNIDIINYIDLISLGDQIGADRIKETKNLPENLIEVFLPYVEDNPPINRAEYNVNLHWTKELSWLKKYSEKNGRLSLPLENRYSLI